MIFHDFFLKNKVKNKKNISNFGQKSTAPAYNQEWPMQFNGRYYFKGN